MNILVVPSIREDSWIHFTKKWHKAKFDKIILVEDNPEKTFHVDYHDHYSWKEIKEDLGDDAWIISRRDSAIRCYGFYKAYQAGATHIFTLDDDCEPLDPQNITFMQEHLDAMVAPKWTESIPGIRTRGLPYYHRGAMTNIALNMGLWTGIPDWDSIQQISNTTPEFVLPKGNRLLPHGQYTPICGMNLCFKAEMTPAAYFPLMGEDSPYGRFDDIWFGVIFKKICDHLNQYISIGNPVIDHKRASNPLVNLVKEAPGIKANEDFWQIIDVIQLKKNDPKECMLEIGKELKLASDSYFSKLGRAICIWANLF